MLDRALMETRAHINRGRVPELWGRSPKSQHQVTALFSDRGSPATLRHMVGYSSHTYSLWHEADERHCLKWHFKTL